MGGGLMQLVAYGAQDIYLTGNPQITFFKVVYRRHTNFAVESIEQTYNGSAAKGSKISVTVSRNGDLLSAVWLVNKRGADVTAAGAWATVDNVEVEIGGQVIDKQYGHWMQVWTDLSLGGDKSALLDDCLAADVSEAGGADVSYMPLQFWFCRNPGLALPLIALQYHEVKLNVTFATLNANDSVSVWCDYVFLDTDERRRMAQNPHEYLIEQLQFTGDESVGSSSNKIKLNFNHPVKELVWVVQPDENVDYCASLECGQPLYQVLGAQPFNYTDAIDALPNAVHAFGGLDQTSGENAFITSSGVFEMDQAGTANGNASWAGATAAGSSLSDAGTFVLAETALDMHCWGENPVVTAKLQLNGQDRFSEREGSYFDVVQPYQHHTRSPETGINVYSFAVRPEEHQPSGSCNFSRIDNAVLQLVLSSGTVSGTNTAKVRVYAVNYNVLRVMSGMAGPAYSN